MGRLISLTVAAADAMWFFNDAYYSGDARGEYSFKWPNATFPHNICIHKDEIDNAELKPKIRCWVENSISDTVIFDVVRKDYRKYYGKSYDWDKSYEVNNTWYRFSFENEQTATVFALVFSEYIKPMTDWHPSRPDDEEYLSRYLEDRYVK